MSLCYEKLCDDLDIHMKDEYKHKVHDRNIDYENAKRNFGLNALRDMYYKEAFCSVMKEIINKLEVEH